MRILRVATALAAAAAALMLAAPPAQAHTVEGSSATNYLTEITDVSPDVPGVEIRVLEFGGQLELFNRSDQEVIVMGYEGEPYLRIGRGGVYENRRSPATYVNADRQGQTPVPPEANAAAEPRWARVSPGRSARWHDHRIHWMGSARPPAVQQDPTREHVVYPEWTVPLQVGGRAVTVTGTLRWIPGPSPWPWVAGAVAAGAVLALVACRLGPSARRWLLVLGSGVLVVLDVWHAVGLAWAPTSPGSPVGRFLSGAILPALGWAAGVVAVRMLWRDKVDGAYPAAFCSLAVLLIGGIGDLSALSNSQVPFAWGAGPARAAVAASVALGGGVLAAAVLHVRRSDLGRPTPRPEPVPA